LTIEPISILIGDGDAAFRRRIRAALEGDGFDVVAETSDASTTISAAARRRPDVCLVDAGLPGNGLNAVTAIARESPAIVIVVFATSSDPADLAAAFQRGASGYLLKGIASDELAKALRATRQGEAALSRAMLPALIDQVRGRSRRRITVPEGRSKLTSRESDVAALLCDGLSTGEMAGRLGLSPVTVRRHVGSMLRKLGAPDRQAAVRVLKQSER
jgi:DNA-binding NarL/FixJ family response regulator